MLQVTVDEEGEPTRSVSFEDGERITFGRAPENDLVLRHNSISRAHGEFSFEGGIWWLLDRGSRAGMIIVRDGDREHLGQGLGLCRTRLSGGEDILILGTRMHVSVKMDESDVAAPALRVHRPAETQLTSVPIFDGPLSQSGALRAATGPLLDGLLEMLVNAVEARDPATCGHSRRVARLCVCLAEVTSDAQSGEWAASVFDEDSLAQLAYAALLHDVGKVAIPEQLLGKTGKLSGEQLDAISARFDLIRALAEVALLHETLAGASGASADELASQVTGRLEPLSIELTECLACIHTLSAGDHPVDDALRENVRCMGARSFLDAAGNTRDFLSPLELECLALESGSLSDPQRCQVERHVGTSFDLARQIPWPTSLSRVPDLVHAHHERLDGSGYPRGLGGIQISLEARILAICDVFDAATRFERGSFGASVEQGVELLREHAAAHRLDSDLVALFVERRVYECTPSSSKLRRLLHVPD